MKKLFCIFMAAMLLFAGCQLQPDDPAPEITEPVVQPIETTEPQFEESPTETVPVIYEQKTMYAISMPPVDNTAYSGDGTAVFHYNYQDMHLMVPEQDVADCIIVDYLNRMDEISLIAEEFSVNAQSQYSAGDTWTPHYYNVYYSPTRIDQEVLSLYGTISSYTGSRPIQTCSAINYNMLTGEVLTLGSILNHINAKALLVDLVIQHATTVKNELHLYDDYADYIAERFDREESFDEDWYFSDTGLCFYFSPYEIAPYSSGIIILEIPYGELTGIVADDFFPPEEEQMIGSICLQKYAEADADNFTQTAQVILDETGERFLMYADGAVLDVKIEVGTWTNVRTEFTPTCTVLSCNSLTPQDAIIVQDLIPEQLPALRISYRSGSDVYTVFLRKDGIISL